MKNILLIASPVSGLNVARIYLSKR